MDISINKQYYVLVLDDLNICNILCRSFIYIKLNIFYFKYYFMSICVK
jgi:hypothetical protein